MIPGPRVALRQLFHQADAYCNAAFTPACNPLLQLGALGWFCYWIVVASGVYLYIFFDSGVTQAYQSVEYLTHTQWYAGGVMRSLHRYASDALVVVVFLHVLRELAMDRMHGPRAFTWVTGVAVLWLLYASGITGYWIVWDRLAQYIAVAASEWLDALPLFGEPVARNFLHSSTLSGRFFTLFVFIHIAVPLFMLFLMWIHLHRISGPRVNPPRALALGCLATLLALSFAVPARSQGPADLTTVTAQINPDWFYLFVFPMLDHVPGAVMWALLFGATVLLAVLPWLLPRVLPRWRVARVDLDNCNGCRRCVQDCPYEALSLQPRSDGSGFSHEAVVDADLCVACGICAGACPTATPFRRRSALVPGIQLPDFDLAALRDEIGGRLAAQQDGGTRVLVVACEGAGGAAWQPGPGVAMVSMPCLGMLPPPFMDYFLGRGQADGLFLAGCGENDCMHRLGERWTRERIARRRDPYLRSRTDRTRLRCRGYARRSGPSLARDVAAFRRELDSAGTQGGGQDG